MARGQRSAVGDTRVAPNGYHYTNTEDGWQLTGRLNAGIARGKPLEKNERIRYEDGDKLNNHPDNLVGYQTKEGSSGSRLAKLYAKRDDIQAQIEALEADQ